MMFLINKGQSIEKECSAGELKTMANPKRTLYESCQKNHGFASITYWPSESNRGY